MNFPLFIFHELIIRLEELNPNIGAYNSHLQKDEAFTLFTNKGSLIVPMHFLQMQFEDPSLFNQTDLTILANNFRASTKDN